MRVELFPFQKRALADIRMKTAEAMGSYHRTHAPQVVSFTAPTGAGKTIIMSALIEAILFGDEQYMEQQDAIIVWLSDSPQLNEQSKQKIDSKADKIKLSQCVTVSEESFDKEVFEDGHVYFLNTQKLSVTSKLTKNGDGRTYTIWQTLANTVREKSDRLYFIIDEAHRGMQGREASKATTIMQKFIKGSDEDHIPPMPVVIGMSATTQRFNALVEGTSSTIHKSIVTADEVRASGLLKDRIVITYPEASAVNNDLAILQAAADDWKEKWEHWTQYCFEQHYAYVNPILIIQVLNGTGGKLTDTNLDDCIAKIEERTGFKLENGQVVHTFGGTTASLTVNGFEVRYEEPSRIADDRNIRVVFFKENLSTGWDCPRAETMMSFKHANDATYIAQLLGRMVRTPMQMHIQVDDVLNDVHLYLPYFSEETVKDVVEALQSTEGGDIPTDIYGESLSGKRFETLTVKPKKKMQMSIPGQMTLEVFANQGTEAPALVSITDTQGAPTPVQQQTQIPDVAEVTPAQPTNAFQQMSADSTQTVQTDVKPTADAQPSAVTAPETMAPDSQQEEVEDLFDREAVMKFINDLSKWDELEHYRLQEDALDKLFFTLCPENKDISDVLLKVSTLNDFYSTNIFSVYPVAKHITSLAIDARLKAGDVTLVGDIQRVVINGSERKFYSFATKYCSHHNPLEYPIYDSYVEKVLKYYRDLDRFAKFSNDDLKDYIRFKGALVDFRRFYHLEQFNLKEIDKYIWQLGKIYFPKDFSKKK